MFKKWKLDWVSEQCYISYQGDLANCQHYVKQNIDKCYKNSLTLSNRGYYSHQTKFYDCLNSGGQYRFKKENPTALNTPTIILLSILGTPYVLMFFLFLRRVFRKGMSDLSTSDLIIFGAMFVPPLLLAAYLIFGE